MNELLEFKEVLIKKIEDTVEERILDHELKDMIKYSLYNYGKLFRPLLLLKICKLYAGDMDKAMNYAIALEMIHTYSLVHDDLPSFDNDDLRRGQATSHKVYGEANAILVGDALLNLAHEIMIDNITHAKDKEISLLISQASGVNGMIYGQFLDMKDYSNLEVNEDIPYIINIYKTGMLIKASIISGYLCSNKFDKNEYELLNDYAVKLGILFQITDDLLECIDDIDIGKDKDSDKKNNKLTYVSILGKENTINKKDEFIKELINLSNKLNISFFEDLTYYIADRIS